MNDSKKHYGMAIFFALACSSLSTTKEPTIKQRAISAIIEEIELFRSAMKGAQKCIIKKQCSRKEKESMYRATKHGIALIGLIALGGLAYRLVPKKYVLDSNFDKLRTSIEKQNDQHLRLLLNLIDFKPIVLKDLLVIAVQFGTDIAVRKLLNRTLPKIGQATFIDKKNTSLLHHAVVRAGNHTTREEERLFRNKIIDLLIQRGAPINYKSGPLQATALMQAAQTHILPVIKRLLRAGADKTIRDINERTAYDYAVRTKAPTAILDLLKSPK